MPKVSAKFSIKLLKGQKCVQFSTDETHKRPKVSSQEVLERRSQYLSQVLTFSLGYALAESSLRQPDTLKLECAALHQHYPKGKRLANCGGENILACVRDSIGQSHKKTLVFKRTTSKKAKSVCSPFFGQICLRKGQRPQGQG